MMMRKGILNRLADALHRWGARPKKGVNEATVKAMSEHLTDLQSIIFGSDRLQLDRRGPSFPEEMKEDAGI
jgi:hypothetical protein